MARQVGKSNTINLSASLRAGTWALAELHAQGRIATETWYKLEVEPIDNNGSYSDAKRTLVFTLENNLRVEVSVMTLKTIRDAVVRTDEGRKWFSAHVYIKQGRRMLAFENHVNQKGYPWTRQPEFDKPLPGETWRAPTSTEVAVLYAAIRNEDEGALLKVYYSDLIEWKPVYDRLGRDTGWVARALSKAAK